MRRRQLQFQWFHSEILLQFSQRAFYMIKLRDCRNVHTAQPVLKLGIPAVHRTLSCEVGGPPRPWRRFQVGLHCVHPWPRCPYTLSYTIFKTFLGRGIVLMKSIQIGELLSPGRHHTFRLPVNVSRVDHGACPAMMFSQWLNEILLNSLLIRLKIAPIGEKTLVGSAPVVKFENDQMGIVHIGRDCIAQAPNQ